MEYSKLHHVKEIISLDCLLNSDLVEGNKDDAKTYDYLLVENGYRAYMYSSLDFVLQNIYVEPPFNLLACIINPNQDCSEHDIKILNL